jgi:hypothetical protein
MEKLSDFSQSTETSDENFVQAIDHAIVNINDTTTTHAMVINKESFILPPPMIDLSFYIHICQRSL